MDNCYCCGKRFRNPDNRTEAFLEDDDNRGVMIGPECAKCIRNAGAVGFAPTRGGPRLFWERLDAKAYAKKLQHHFTEHPNIFNNVVAAQTFCSKLAKDCVVVHIGRKFGVVKPDVAKRMKLKVISQTPHKNLTAFFDGAFSANSGGKSDASTFEKLSHYDLMQADQELDDITKMYGISASVLGAMADAGYTLHGQTRQSADEDGDDEQHELLAFTLLSKMY